MKLWEIANRFQDALNEYNSAQTDEEQQAALTKLQAIEGEKQEKVQACCAWLRELELDAEKVQKEIERLGAVATRLYIKAEHFRGYISSCVPLGEKFKSPFFEAGWKKCPPSVVVEDESQVPAQYMREKISYDVDKKGALPDLQNGAKIPGLKLEDNNYKFYVK